MENVGSGICAVLLRYYFDDTSEDRKDMDVRCCCCPEQVRALDRISMQEEERQGIEEASQWATLDRIERPESSRVKPETGWV